MSKEIRVPYEDIVLLLDRICDLTEHEIATWNEKQERIKAIHEAIKLVHDDNNIYESGGVEQIPDNVIQLKKRLNKPSSDLFFD
tara:strand:- start:191 stop:442 length:252 start_codon:yes stop_codon:yes gene_type:complete